MYHRSVTPSIGLIYAMLHSWSGEALGDRLLITDRVCYCSSYRVEEKHSTLCQLTLRVVQRGKLSSPHRATPPHHDTITARVSSPICIGPLSRLTRL